MDDKSTFLHGGKPWDYWAKEGQFIYVFGEVLDDDDLEGQASEEFFVKIGITKDPANRLTSHRRNAQKEFGFHGTWYSIVWLENSAPVVENVLKKVFHQFKHPLHEEWFNLPRTIFSWVEAGMKDEWFWIVRDVRRSGLTDRTIITEWLPNHYPHPFIFELNKRAKSHEKFHSKANVLTTSLADH